MVANTLLSYPNGSQKRGWRLFYMLYLVSFLFTIATDLPANIAANSSSSCQRYARFSSTVTKKYGIYFRAFKKFSMNFQRFFISICFYRKMSSRSGLDLSTRTYRPPLFLTPLNCSEWEQSRGKHKLFIFRPESGIRFVRATHIWKQLDDWLLINSFYTLFQ